MSTSPKVRALEEFDRALTAAKLTAPHGEAYAYALGLVQSKVPTDHLLWAAGQLAERFPTEPPPPSCGEPNHAWADPTEDGPATPAGEPSRVRRCRLCLATRPA